MIEDSTISKKNSTVPTNNTPKPVFSLTFWWGTFRNPHEPWVTQGGLLDPLLDLVLSQVSWDELQPTTIREFPTRHWGPDIYNTSSSVVTAPYLWHPAILARLLVLASRAAPGSP